MNFQLSIATANFYYFPFQGTLPGCLKLRPGLPCFTTPVLFGDASSDWWNQFAPAVVKELARYRNTSRALAIKNLSPCDGYSVSLSNPNDLRSFANSKGLIINLDVSHYAQPGDEKLALGFVGNIGDLARGDCHQKHLNWRKADFYTSKARKENDLLI